ncbi:hypothetical protein PFISCL1PPCAC_5345, partial [Pristionchus fissidentatus]
SPAARTPNANTPDARTPIGTSSRVDSGNLTPTPTAATPSTAGTPIGHSIESNDVGNDENGTHIRGQERVSYENMLVRYGAWSRIKGQILVYTVLLIIGVSYKGHNEQYKFLGALKTVKGHHIQCCCNIPKSLKDMKDLIGTFEEGGA